MAVTNSPPRKAGRRFGDGVQRLKSRFEPEADAETPGQPAGTINRLGARLVAWGLTTPRTEAGEVLPGPETVDDLEAEIDIAHARIAELVLKRIVQESHDRDLRSQIDQARDRIRGLKEQRAETRDEIDRITKEIKAEQGEVSRLQRIGRAIIAANGNRADSPDETQTETNPG